MAVKPATNNAPYSTAIIKRTVAFQTEEAKGFLGNRLAGIAVALFTLDVISRKRIARLNMSTKDHKAASKALNKLLTDFETSLNDESARLQAILKSQKITSLAAHNNPGTEEVEITTPELKRVLEILMQFDKLIILVDTVWLEGFMETDVANKFRVQKNAQLKRLFGSIYKLSQAAKQSAFVKDDVDTQAAIAREEEKLGVTEENDNQPTQATSVVTEEQAVA